MCKSENQLGFIPVSSHASFVLPEVDARANLMHCPCIHLVKPEANVHMTPGGTVISSSFGGTYQLFN